MTRRKLQFSRTLIYQPDMVETEMVSLIEADLNKTKENQRNNNERKKSAQKWIRITYD